jgi:hypothetical protein
LGEEFVARRIDQARMARDWVARASAVAAAFARLPWAAAARAVESRERQAGHGLHVSHEPRIAALAHRPFRRIGQAGEHQQVLPASIQLCSGCASEPRSG